MNAAFHSQELPDVPFFTQTSLQGRSLSIVKSEEIPPADLLPVPSRRSENASGMCRGTSQTSD